MRLSLVLRRARVRDAERVGRARPQSQIFLFVVRRRTRDHPSAMRLSRPRSTALNRLVCEARRPMRRIRDGCADANAAARAQRMLAANARRRRG